MLGTILINDYYVNDGVISCLWTYFQGKSSDKKFSEGSVLEAIENCGFAFAGIEGLSKDFKEKTWSLLSLAIEGKAEINHKITLQFAKKVLSLSFIPEHLTKIIRYLTPITEEKDYASINLEEISSIANFLFYFLDEVPTKIKRQITSIVRIIPTCEGLSGEEEKLASSLKPIFLALSKNLMPIPKFYSSKPLPMPTRAVLKSSSSSDTVVASSSSPNFFQRLLSASSSTSNESVAAAAASPETLEEESFCEMALSKAVEEQQIQKLTTLLQTIVSCYIDETLALATSSFLKEEVQKNISLVTSLLFISTPRNLNRKDIVFLEAAIKGFINFSHQILQVKKSYPNQPKFEVIFNHICRINQIEACNLAEVNQRCIREILEKLLGMKKVSYKALPSPFLSAALESVMRFLKIHWNDLLNPHLLNLAVQRFISEVPDLETLEGETLHFNHYQATDPHFSHRIEQLIAPLVMDILSLGGSGFLANLIQSAIVAFVPKFTAGTGDKLQRAINKVLNSPVSMTPLLILFHTLVYKTKESYTATFGKGTTLKYNENLREEIFSKILPHINSNEKIKLIIDHFPGIDVKEIIHKLIDLFICVTEKKEAIDLFLYFMLTSISSVIPEQTE